MKNSETTIRQDDGPDVIEQFFAKMFLCMGAGIIFFAAVGFIILKLEMCGIDIVPFM